MATDMLIIRQNMMRLIPATNKTYTKPLNYYTAAVIKLKFTLHNWVIRYQMPKISQNGRNGLPECCLRLISYELELDAVTPP